MSRKDPVRPPERPGGRPDPARPRRWVQTLSPRGIRPIRVLALNDLIAGAFTHFLWSPRPEDCRTVACTLDLDRCEGCAKVKNRRWKGYLGVALAGVARPVLLEITQAAWDETPELQAKDGKLRGTQWDCWRTADSSRAKMKMRQTLNIVENPRWGRVDVVAVLARLWNQEESLISSLFPGQDGGGGWGCDDGTAPGQPSPSTEKAEPWRDWFGNPKKDAQSL